MVNVYKGNIIFSQGPNKLVTIPNGYIVVEDMYVKDILKAPYKDAPVTDFGDNLIIPGFVDLHLHAPQYENRGLGLDKELLTWLEMYTFAEEAKFSELAYAKRVYQRFINDLYESGTTRAVVYSTVHKEATMLLFDIFIESGLGAYIGKCNMDRNCPKELRESTENSIADTLSFINYKEHPLVRPIITPRFAPSCSDALLKALGTMAGEHNLPLQSHLSESNGELEFVRSLYPNQIHYTGVYEEFGCFNGSKTIMAHCIHNTEEEVQILKKYGVYVAHCPLSNTDISSGICPVKSYINKGLNIGLGSDVSGGCSLYIPDSIVEAIRVSKLYSIYVDSNTEALSFAEAFYLATKGGGSFFGKVGSFEEGYAFDALVIDDSALCDVNKRSLQERLEQFIYCGSKQNIVKRYVNGVSTKASLAKW